MSIYAGVQGKKEVFDGYASLDVEKKRLVSVWGNKEGKKEELFNVFPKNSFIAGGSPLRYSKDGATWTTSTGLTVNLDHILLSYVKDRFVCLCGRHSSSTDSELKMFSSFDGLNWVEILTEEMKELNSLDPDNSSVVNWAFGEEKIVLLKEDKVFSFDGKKWTRMSGIEDGRVNLYGVAYGNGKFVAITSIMSYYSIDGIKWNKGGSLVGMYSELCYADGLFIVVDGDYDSRYSVDGVTWTTATGLPLYTNNIIDNVVYINGNTYCRVIEYDSANKVTSSSLYQLNKESMRWEYFSELPTSKLRSITNVNEKFLGYVKNSGSFYSSEDGITWTEVSSPYDSSTSIVFTYGDGKVVVLTQEASAISLCSKDEGVTWLDSKYGNVGNFYDKKKKRLLRCERTEVDGIYYLIQYSYDGRKWKPLLNGPTSTSSSSSRSLSKIIYANERYVAVGTYGLSFYSLDGEEWIEMSGLYVGNYSYDVCFGGGIFVAFASLSSGVRYSTDGVTWLTPTTQPSSTSYSIAYGNGKFVAVSASGKSFYSTNGNVWTVSTGLNTAYSYKVAYGNGKFIALPQSGSSSATLYYSLDGITWTALTADIKKPSSSGIVFGNGRFVLLTGIPNLLFNYYSFDGVEWLIGDSTSNEVSNFVIIENEGGE